MHAYSQAPSEFRYLTFSFDVHEPLSVSEPSPAYDPSPSHEPSSAEASDGLLLHKSIQRLFRIGNRVRVELIAALRTLHEEQLYLELGYSSFTQYCQRELGPVEISPRRFDCVCEGAEAIRIESTETTPANALPAIVHPALADGEIDQPNSTRLIRQVLNRDGKRCANPGCGSRHQLQAHHIVFRADGGRTALANEVAVCSTCHSLIHEGLLEVTGSAARSTADLKWRPRCRRGENTAAIESMWQQINQSAYSGSAARTVTAPRRRPAKQDLNESSDPTQGDRKAWIRTLRSMGFSAEEARDSVHEAVERIERSGFTATDATVMKTVFDRDR